LLLSVPHRPRGHGRRGVPDLQRDVPRQILLGAQPLMALWLLDDKDVKEIRRFAQWIRNFRGNIPGGQFVNSPTGASFSTPPPGRGGVNRRSEAPILAKITGNTSIADNIWEYDWEEAEVTA